MSNKKGLGKVFLVGAGPGDPGLITIKGRQLLEKADVIVYDYLANKKLLRHAAAEVKLIYVGKKGGGYHARTQEEIKATITAGRVVQDCHTLLLDRFEELREVGGKSGHAAKFIRPPVK